MYEMIRLQTIQYEKEMLKVKLSFAQAEVVKVKAEEAAIQAKKVCAEKEVEILSRLLNTYADAELKLKSTA